MAIVDRSWTDTTGYQTTAKFVRIRDGNVVLLRGARTIMLPFDSLSSGDQEYVRQLLRSRGEEDQIPLAVAPVADSPAGAAPVAGDLPAATPEAQPAPLDLDGPKVGRGNSDFFDKYRQRDEQTRQQHAQ